MENNSLKIWETINRFQHLSKKVINIFVGSNCDSAAGSLTLTSLLKSSLLAFSIHPISSSEELRELIKSSQAAQELSTSKTDDLFILIGVGGALPLDEYFDFTQQVVILLDSYRPIDLQTLRIASERGDRLIIWGISRIEEDVNMFFHQLSMQEARKRRRQRQRIIARKRRLGEPDHNAREGEEYTEENATEEDQDDEDEEEEEGDNDELSFLDREGGDQYGSNTENNAEESEGTHFINWLNSEEVSIYAKKKYAAASGGCRSCALDAYDLSILLNRMNSSFLWHAAVGICDLYCRRCIDYGAYLMEMRPLHDAVALQLGGAPQHALNQSSASPETHSGASGIFTELSVNTLHSRRETSSNSIRLRSVEQPQVFLLQHISLWDALWNDPIISSALGFYHFDTGESKLKFLLAKCGVSLEMAHRPWHEIRKEERDCSIRLIQQELKNVLDGSPLLSFCSPNLSLRTISRAAGFSREVTAFDVCVLFDGVQAACPSDDVYFVEDDAAELHADAEKRGGKEYEKKRSFKVAQKLVEFHRSQFWKATAIIGLDPTRKEFNSAIMETVMLYHLVSDATSALMQPSLILSTQALHYVQFSDPAKTASALESFQTIFRLNALANRLLFTLTEERGVARYTRAIRPLLLAAPLPCCTSGKEVEERNRKRNNQSSDGAEESSGVENSLLPTSEREDNRNEDEMTYIMTMSTQGVTGSGLIYVKAVHVFNECVEKDKDFDIPPLRSSLFRNCVYVNGRENAMHLAELMHLRSLQP